MYSIIRFTAQADRLAELEEIGRDMNTLRTGVYRGLRRAGDGFACDLSSSGDWREHQNAARQFLEIFGSHITRAHQTGARTTIDMSLGHEDLVKPIESLHFGAEFLRIVSTSGVALEVT